MTGKIKNVNVEKNYGFLVSDDDNKEYFFHRSCLVNDSDWQDLERGRHITFEPSPSPKGPRAENVMLK